MIFSFSASMVDWTKNHQMSPTLSIYLFAFKRVMHKYIFSFVCTYFTIYLRRAPFESDMLNSVPTQSTSKQSYLRNKEQEKVVSA